MLDGSVKLVTQVQVKNKVPQSDDSPSQSTLSPNIPASYPPQPSNLKCRRPLASSQLRPPARIDRSLSQPSPRVHSAQPQHLSLSFSRPPPTAMHEPTSPSRASPPTTPPRVSSPTTSLDLTNTNSPRSPYRGPLPPHMTKFHSSLRSPFSVAYRRVHSRRERIYSRSNPDLLAERLDISEDTPFHSTLREKALLHISYAYACAGYAHAALCIIVSLALAALVFSFAKSLYSDVMRKTRIRADDIAITAAECYLSRLKNDCILSDDAATAHHPTPALDTLCKKWLACERRGKHASADAYSASIWAETAAETVNSFAERIHSTSVVISLLIVVVVLFLMSSAAFGFMHVRVADTSRLDRSVASEMLQKDDVLQRRPSGPVPIAYNAQRPGDRARITVR